jgi:aspartate kinase
MKVLKFGGTSVGSAQRMKDVAKLITDGEQKIVVLSAMSGTTNTLVEISDYLYKKNPEGANEVVNKLEAKYKQHIDELFSTEEYKQKTLEFVKSVFDYIRSFTKDIFTLFEEKVILAQGEIISTNMVTNYLCEQGVKAVLIPALEFMRTDKNSEPDLNYIREKLALQLEANPGQEIYITQGFICRNAYGEIDNLQRGGSDYTASLIGAAVNASEIQIWTDIDGMHDNDPRVVDKTSPVRQLHFEEAAELAYFGAKILHPTCVQPAKYANIPVRLLNTIEPSAPGTLISNETEKGKIKAVAAKDNITAIKIKSSRMLLAHGFLRKVFEIFESYQTPIDMVCTSEVGVSMSIDNTKHLNEIVNDLKKYGTVTVDHDMCIVCVVGDLEWENIGFEAKAIQAMRNIPVRMISFGGSNYNISFLIRESDKKTALQSLSDVLFNNANQQLAF